MKACAVKLAVLASLFLFPAAAHAQTTSGSIYGTETWDASMNPIMVTGDITVEDGATLTIGHGCDIRFQQNSDDTHWGWDLLRSEIIVYGTLHIDGSYSGTCTGPPSPGESVLLIDEGTDFVEELVGPGTLVMNVADGSKGIVTNISTTTNPHDTIEIAGGMSGGATNLNESGDGYLVVVPVTLTSTGTGSNGWFGIIFSDGSATGTISYCNIDHSVYGINFTACAPAPSQPVVANCNINDVSFGIYFDDSSSPTIIDTSIIQAQIAFDCWAASSPTITNCNAAELTGEGVAVYATEWTTPSFTGCAFSSGSVKLDYYADLYIQDTTISDAGNAVIGYEFLAVGQAVIPSYTRIEMNNCNIIGLGDIGNGIEWDDNLDICKVEYSRIGGFQRNVFPRWGSEEPDAGIFHAVGLRFGGTDPNNVDLGDRGDPDPYRYWPPGYTDYSDGENEFYGVQDPDCLFNIGLEQSDILPPSLYQLEVWAENNWWVSTIDSVLSRYIWDHSDVQELGAVHYIPHRIPDKKRTYSVSGQILDNIGDPVEGVRVWVDISAQFPGHTVLADITGDDGYYIIYGLLPSATAYSIVPEKLFYTFSPSSITVTIDPVNPSDSTGHDFDATLPPPRVLSVSRADGLDGGAFGLPGRTNWGKQSETTPVVVTGLNLRETPSIFLQGPLPTTTVSSCSNVQWVTSTKVTATVPAGLATGDYSFWVVNPDGQDTLWGDAASPGFTIVPPPPPHVNSINPNPINDSYMGYLTVTGEDFQSGCNLTIDGYTWSSLTPSGEGTLLVVYHAPGTLPSGTWPVTVTNPGGQTSNDDVTLTVNGAPPPVVDSIDPDHGPNNRVVSVTIHGSDFVEMPRVLIGATECLNETFIDTTRLTAQIPTGIAPGTYDVTVVNPDGQPGVLSDGYTVDEAALNVLGVSPPMGRESGETEIILVGENFKSSPGPTVSVGSTGCANVRVISQTCLIATVPSGLTADLYGVTVDNNDGQAAVTLSDAFTVIGTPIITGVTITSGGGDTNKTTSITIDGSRFAYIPVVEIESSPPTRCTDVRFISSAELRANVPSGIAPGTYHVRVTNPLDQSDILSGIYTVRAAPGEPELLGVTPSSGRNNTETAITITGSNFSTPALVWVGSTECTDVVVQPGATEITATVPAGIPVGSHDLIVGSGLYAGTMTHGFTVGGSGTLNADTTFSRNAYLTGDIVVPDGITLTIEPGVLLTFQALRDDTSGGWDTERGEVRVYGRVNILGQDEGRITVTSDGAARSDWLGIVLSDTTASAWIEYALFTNAVYGLSFESNLNTPAANNPRPWVRNVNIASCSTGIALNSSIAFTCPAIDTCSIDGVQTGIIAAGTAAPIFTTTLFRNVSATGFNGKENAIVTMQNSSIVDAPKAIWCPQALTGEKINASILNLIFSVIGNGAIDLSDSASLTARMVTHLLFPDIEEIGVGMLFDGATYLNWDYSNIVQGAPDGKGLDWRSAGACSISNTVFANWGVGLIRQGRCGEVNLGDGLRDGNPGRNEFLGIMNPLATFNVHNSCSGDVSARYNWWLTTDYSVIDNYLYDEDDDPALGNIDYSDFLTGPRTYSVSGRIADTMEQGVDRVQVVASYSADRICTGGGADRLEDDTVDFYGIGAYVGITVGNLTDGSSGTVTDILTTTNPNDTLEIAGGMSGGASNDPGDGYHFPRTYNDRIGMTDNDGYYTVYGLVPGGYTIEPGKQDYTFTPATLDVTVTDTDINGQDFTGRLPLPVVTNVNREDGADGAAYGLAGRTNWGLTYETTDIVVAGINFRATPTIYLMRNPTPSASDQACANVEWIDSTRLTATVSAQLDPGDYYVRVVNPDGQYDVWNDFPGFTIVPPPAPSVYGIAPNPIQYDYEGTLAITGNNFLFYGGYGPTVTIRTQTWEYPSPTVWGDKNNLYIRYDVGMLPVGTYPVSVTNPDGQGSNDDVTLEVTVADPPVVTGIEPNPMEIDYAGYLTIHGQGFIDGCSVTIDGQTWSGLYVWGGGTILRVNHNYGMLPPGTHPVIVTNPDEQVSNDDVTLTVNPAPPPVVAGIDPDPININYSGNLTVTGRDFIVGCRLTIDGRTWSSLVPQINGTILEVYHASGILSPGTHSVVVTNPDGQTSNTDVTLTVAGPTPTPTSPPPTPPPTHTPTNTPLPTPTPTPRPLLNLLVSPAEPELFKPLSIHLSVEVGPELPSRFDAWGIIYPPRGGQLFFKGAPPCSLSPVPAPMVSNVSLSSDYSGTLFAVPSVPLGAEGTYIVRVGFVNPGVIPSGPDDFIPRYGDEKAVKISMP